jgi:hypothetical protein
MPLGEAEVQNLGVPAFGNENIGRFTSRRVMFF